MKVLFVVGARPQFIKLAPLYNLLSKEQEIVIIHTGQHFDKEMSEKFFVDLRLPRPKYNLDVNNGLHGEQTGRMLIELEKAALKEKPDLIIIFGDTNSTLAGGLVASKAHIPVVHIEAGLRSFNKNMPEEINRIVADHTSDFLFAPTKTAMNNLSLENLSAKSYLTGDIMVDSLKDAVYRLADSDILNNYSLQKDEYYLLTLHRPYNVDDPVSLANILSELGKLNSKVIFPVHPRTKKIIEDNKLLMPKNFRIIKPVGYLDFVQLQLNSIKIITDSGGIQKEAYILEKPCITLRSESEWIETIESGWNLLINPNSTTEYSGSIEDFFPPSTHLSLFGENVATKMTEIIHKKIG